MRDTNEHMIAGIMGIIPHKVAVLIILSTLTLEINRISRFIHITIFSAALPVGILISIGRVDSSLTDLLDIPVPSERTVQTSDSSPRKT